jgi:hypothetical protein
VRAKGAHQPAVNAELVKVVLAREHAQRVVDDVIHKADGTLRWLYQAALEGHQLERVHLPSSQAIRNAHTLTLTHREG